MQQRMKGGDPGSVNVYVCPKGGETWVRHVDMGTTPFLIRCRADGCPCRGGLHGFSRGYPKDIPDGQVGLWEWWRPRTATDARLAAAADIEAAVRILMEFPEVPTPQNKEAAINSLVDHWRAGGAFLRRSAEPWKVNP